MKTADNFLARAKVLLARQTGAAKADATEFVIVEARRLFGLDETTVVERVFDEKPAGWWTLERCKADALRFKTRAEWSKGSGSAYNAARKNGWLEECCGHMEYQQLPNGYWTLERCKEDALRFRTRAGWQKGSGSAYVVARRNGWLEECCAHMALGKTPDGHWTLERCKQDALRFKTRAEWSKGSCTAYGVARKNGWSEECCGHMELQQMPNGYWTLERCKADALRFDTRKEWKKGSPGYDAACRNGWLDECCAHMEKGKNPDGHWTLERCKEDALQFKTRGEWKNGSPGYGAAYKNGWLEECCAHMEAVRNPGGYWTLERCKADALRFETRSAWDKGSRSGYGVALRNRWLEECCGHMAKRQGRKK